VEVVAPVNSTEEVKPLISAGASELYLGVLDKTWIRRYSPVCAPNRREWRDSNLDGFCELAEVVEEAERFGVPVSVAVNPTYFAGCQERDLEEYVKKACEAGVDSFFVPDPATVALLSELDLGVGVHVSSVASVFNSEAVKFYRSLGADRFILPRHLKLSEIGGIVKGNQGTRFETFVLFNRCVNVDGLCTFLHGEERYGLGDNACSMRYSINAAPKNKRTEKNIREYIQATQDPDQIIENTIFQCGLCALPYFRRWGVHAVKVIGRGKPLWQKEYGVRLVKLFLNFLEEKPTEREYRMSVREFVQNRVFPDRQRKCNPFNCYYPALLPR